MTRHPPKKRQPEEPASLTTKRAGALVCLAGTKALSVSRVDQDAGVHQPLRIEFALGAAERARKQFGPLPVVEGAVEAADRMVMRGRAAVLDGGGGAGRQDRHELVEHDPLVEDP